MAIQIVKSYHLDEIKEGCTLVTVVWRVKWTPPAGSLEGRSNELMMTPPFNPFIPLSLTDLVVKVTPGTEMPGKIYK